MTSPPDLFFQHRGWTFATTSGPIGAANDLEALGRTLVAGPEGAGDVELKAPLPEQTFTRNSLVIRNDKTGFTLKFDTKGALEAWHKAQAEKYGSPPDETGKKTGISAVNFDWTYAEGRYDGGVCIDQTTPLPRPEVHEGDRGAAASDAAAAATATTGASGQDDVSPFLPIENASLSSSLNPSLQLPMALLTRRDPFLFFASFPLYADDLHDKGVVECTVKIRVMESVFLVLLRLYLRIDASRVFLRDVRYCHVFSTPPATSTDHSETETTVSDNGGAGARREEAAAAGSSSSIASSISSGVAAVAPWSQGNKDSPSSATARVFNVAASSSSPSDDGGHGFVVLKSLQVREMSAAVARQLLGLPPLRTREELLADTASSSEAIEPAVSPHHHQPQGDTFMREVTADDIYSAASASPSPHVRQDEMYELKVSWQRDE